jgi:hypothetical protein
MLTKLSLSYCSLMLTKSPSERILAHIAITFLGLPFDFFGAQDCYLYDLFIFDIGRALRKGPLKLCCVIKHTLSSLDNFFKRSLLKAPIIQKPA